MKNKGKHKMGIASEVRDYFDKGFCVPATKWFEIMSDIEGGALDAFKKKWVSISGGFDTGLTPLHVRRLKDHAKDWYWLSVTLEGIYIYASSDGGVERGLKALCRLAAESKGTLPCCEIKDGAE